MGMPRAKPGEAYREEQPNILAQLADFDAVPGQLKTSLQRRGFSADARAK
jgi:hypothetical protein